MDGQGDFSIVIQHETEQCKDSINEMKENFFVFSHSLHTFIPYIISSN